MKHLRDGIHDHHINAARTDQERAAALANRDAHYPDARCWVFFDRLDATGNPHPLDNDRDPLNRGRCTRCGDLGCRCDAHYPN